MADGKDIGILLKALLDTNVVDINKQIKTLSTKIDKLKIKLDIDTKEINILANKLKGLQIGNINNPLGSPKSKPFIDADAIEIQITKINNQLDRLKVNKDKVFADTRVSSEVLKLKDLETQFRNGAISSKEYALQMDNVRTKTAQVAGEFRNVNHDGYGFIDMISLAAKKFMIWQISVGGVMFALRSLRDGIQNLKAIDTELINIAKVTDYTSQEMKELAKNATEVGKGFGREANDYLKAVTEFARAGMGKQAEELGKTSLLLQNVGDVSADTANEMLLAVNAAYDLGGSQEELTKVIDKLNLVSNQNPTSVAKMADGIKVAASVFEQAGFSIDEFIALVGTATSSTQRSGAEMARGLRTVLMNIRGVQDEEAETTLESISKAEGVLKSIGIEVRKSATEFREPMQVLSELAQKYEELGEAGRTVKQAEILESLAGKRQSNILASVLKQWDMVNKQISEAANSQGSAMRENEIYMQSWEARTKQLSATMTMFWQNLISTDVVKGFISSLTQTVNILDTLVNNSFSQFAIQVGLTATAINLLVLGFTTLKAKAIASIASIVGVDIAQKGLLATTKALSKALLTSPIFWISIGTVGLVKLIDYLNTSIEEQKEKVEKLSEEYDTLKSKINGLEDELKSTGTRIDELNAKDKLSIIEQDELEKLKLSNKELQARIDLLNQQEKITAEKLGNEALKLYDKTTPEVSRSSIDYFKNTPNQSIWEVIENRGSSKDTQNINLLMAAYEKLIELQKESSNPKDIQKYSEQLTGVKDKIVDQNLALSDIRDKLRQLPNPTEEQKKAIDSINNALLYTQSLLDPDKLFNDTWSSLDKDQQQYLQTLSKTNQLTPITLQQYGELFNLIKNGGFSFNDLKQAIDSTNVVQKQNAENIELVIEKTKELDDLYKDTTANLEDLNQAIYDVSQGEELSAKQVEELILKYPELQNHIRKTVDGYTIEKSAIDILNQVRQTSIKTALLAQVGITESAYNGLKERLKAYDIEIVAISGLADAYKAMMPYLASGSTNQQIIKDALAYGQAMEKIKTLRQTLSDPTYGVKETKEKKSETDIKQIEIDQFYKLQEAIDRTNNSIENNKKLLSNTEDTKEQISILEKLISLYKEQQNQLHKITEAKRNSIEANKKELESYGFDITYDRTTNDLRITNEERINKIYGKNNEETNKLRDKLQDIIKQTKEWNKDNIDAGSEWQNLAGYIKGAYGDISEIYKKQTEDTAKLAEEQKKLWDDSNKTVIDLLKKRYEKEKKIEEKAHKDRIDALDDELDSYKKYINDRLEEQDRLYATEDYQKDVSEKSKEILDVQKEIDRYSLAANQGDLESLARIKELNQQKLKLESDLQDTQIKRERDLSKQNLQDNLSNFEEYIKSKKDAEDESFENYKTQLEASTSETALALEAQKLLMTNSVTEIQNSLVQLFTDVGENATIAGKLVQDELISKLMQLQYIGSGLNITAGISGNNRLSSILGASSSSVMNMIKSFVPSSASNIVNNYVTNKAVPTTNSNDVNIGDINISVAGNATTSGAGKLAGSIVSQIKDLMIKGGNVKR